MEGRKANIWSAKILLIAVGLLLLTPNIPVSAAGDFIIYASPISASVTPGNETEFSITAYPTDGFSGPVSLTATVSPMSPEVSVSFNRNPLQPSTCECGVAYPDEVTMTLRTTSIASGVFEVTVSGSSGSLSHSASVSVKAVAQPKTTTSSTSPTGVTSNSRVSNASTNTQISTTRSSSTQSASRYGGLDLTPVGVGVTAVVLIAVAVALLRRRGTSP